MEDTVLPIPRDDCRGFWTTDQADFRCGQCRRGSDSQRVTVVMQEVWPLHYRTSCSMTRLNQGRAVMMSSSNAGTEVSRSRWG
jgi:hypothetical protein